MQKSTEEVDVYSALREPFDPKFISWRVGATNKEKTKGIALAYIDSRTAMKRFDDVFGLNWQCRYSHASKEIVICEIGCKIDGEWLWRANGAGETNYEATKGSISDAFKRAAVLWGVGRYLYYLPNKWVEIDEYKRIKQPPDLPNWALPESIKKAA